MAAATRQFPDTTTTTLAALGGLFGSAGVRGRAAVAQAVAETARSLRAKDLPIVSSFLIKALRDGDEAVRGTACSVHAPHQIISRAYARRGDVVVVKDRQPTHGVCCDSWNERVVVVVWGLSDVSPVRRCLYPLSANRCARR